MKRTITLLLLFFALLSVSAKVKITRIDPTDWYVGMKDPTLQLMVYGEGIRDAEVSTDYPHARSTPSRASTRPTICSSI